MIFVIPWPDGCHFNLCVKEINCQPHGATSLFNFMGKKNLFVMIDDDTDDHEIFNMAIQELKKPIQCIFFPDCESALAHFSSKAITAPGYVFIDINLPRINGDECLQKLQKLREFDSPCIIIYSASIPDEYKPRLEEIGVDKFIEKTGSITRIADQIRRLLKN